MFKIFVILIDDFLIVGIVDNNVYYVVLFLF